MAGPAKTTLSVTPGAGVTEFGYNDVDGNFTVGVAAGSHTPIVGASWTNATTAGVGGTGAANTVDCAGYGHTIISVTVTGTVTGGIVTVEGFDGTQWASLAMARVKGDFPDFGTYALSAGNQMWKVDTGGMQKVRVRLSTAIVGSGSVVTSITPQAGSISAFVHANLTTGLDRTSDSVTNYDVGNAYFRIIAASTVNASSLKTGAGVLVGVLVGAIGTGCTVAIYDATTATGTPVTTLTIDRTGFISCGNLAFTAGLSAIYAGTPGEITLIFR